MLVGQIGVNTSPHHHASKEISVAPTLDNTASIGLVILAIVSEPTLILLVVRTADYFRLIFRKQSIISTFPKSSSQQDLGVSPS